MKILIVSILAFFTSVIILFSLYALGLNGIMSGWFAGVIFGFIFFYFTFKDKDDGKEK